MGTARAKQAATAIEKEEKAKANIEKEEIEKEEKAKATIEKEEKALTSATGCGGERC